MQNTLSNFETFYGISPTPTMAWTEEKKVIFANQAALELFKVESIDELNNDFASFSPFEQPSFSHEINVYYNRLKNAFKDGAEKFFWLHLDSEKNEISTEVSFNHFEFNNTSLVIAIVENLNPYTMDNSKDRSIEDYFTNTLSSHVFMTHVYNILDHKFFYWDLRTGMVTFYGNEALTDASMGKKIRFPEFFIENKIVHPDYIEHFDKLIENARLGIKTVADIKGRTLDGSYKFFRIRYETVIKQNGIIYAVTGTIGDADEEKALENQAMTDMLTSCYNKVTAENMISDYLHQDAKSYSALFIIDVDNFKAINDNLGHHFGDVVLREISSALHASFRSDDIIGRIGGDEFLVLAKNLREEELIEERAQKILEALQEEYQGDTKKYKISGSIGIARFPFDGISFEELYKSADKALYQSKLKGKNVYTIYTPDLVDGTMKNTTLIENAGRIADSYFDAELIHEIFDIMYEAKDISSSIILALKVLGERYHADRSYIFESFDDGITYSNTYEWCKLDVNPEIDNLQNLTAEVLTDFFEDADDEGILYSNDLSVLDTDGAFKLMDDQGIKSFIHSQVFENNKVKLFLGLDDCTNTRVWTVKELNSLKYLSKMLSIFLRFNKEKLTKL